MIVKNEEEVLDRCLRSVMPVIRELIIVDTGSTDETLQIAALHGARIHSFPWNNDYAAARNFSLNQATLSWILVMDADEVLSEEHAQKLSELASSQCPEKAFSFVARNYLHGSGQLTWDQSWKPNTGEDEEGKGFPGYLDHPVVRLFPRNPKIRFSGCVHEGVQDSLFAARIPIESSGLVLHHYGQVRSPERMHHKKNLYLELGWKKLRDNPQDARTHFEMAIQLQGMERYEEAIPHYEAAKQLDSAFRISELYLGICYSRLNKYVEARQCLLLAQKVKTDSVEIFFELGRIDLKESRLAEARQNLEHVLKINPSHVESLCYLGALQVNHGQTDLGFELLERAIEIDPNHHDSWMNLGLAFQKRGDQSKALDCLEKAHRLRPEDPAIARQYGLLLAKSGRPNEAASVLGQAVRLTAEDEALTLYWAASLAASGERQQAHGVLWDLVRKGGKLSQLAQQQIEKMGVSPQNKEKEKCLT